MAGLGKTEAQEDADQPFENHPKNVVGMDHGGEKDKPPSLE